MERAKGILFDKDGTLIDFEATWLPVIRETLRELGARYGASERALAAIARANGVTDTGFTAESPIRSETTSALARRWSAQLREYGTFAEAAALGSLITDTAVRLSSTVALIPGTRELLKRLKSRGYRLGIATADTRDSTEAGLRAVGILGYFDFVSADGDGFPAKPEPSAALAFCRRFGIVPKDLVVVGDSIGDMRFAQQAGSRFIGMRSGGGISDCFSADGYPVIPNFTNPAAFERLIA